MGDEGGDAAEVVFEFVFDEVEGDEVFLVDGEGGGRVHLYETSYIVVDDVFQN